MLAVMSKVKAKLRVLDLRNEKVHTRWGYVQFDNDGMAELEVPEDELDMLRQTKPFPWLYEPVSASHSASEVTKDEAPAFDVSDAPVQSDAKKQPKQGSRK
jgi:hypothetical protein